MANPHLSVIRSAIRYNRNLRQLFNSAIGTKEHPRGGILAAYLRARRGLAGNIGNQAATGPILDNYRTEVIQATIQGATAATQIGATQATETLAAYQLPLAIPPAPAIAEATAAVAGVIDNQIIAIQAGVISEAQILGGASRVGLFAPGVVQREAANWLAGLAAMTFGGMMDQSLELSGVAKDYVKQAVAAVDERTTPCCLGVHGQIRDIDEDFSTPNVPAYASHQPRPPFHDYCRTSQVLVLRQFSADDLTFDMHAAASLETKLRKRPGYTPPHPANAFTRIRT